MLNTAQKTLDEEQESIKNAQKEIEEEQESIFKAQKQIEEKLTTLLPLALVKLGELD